MIPSIQTISMSGLLSLALLLTACQPASEPAPLPPQETAVNQAATVALPTALPTRTNTPFPTDTPSPSAPLTLGYTSQGDQLPTRSPASLPTPTAIPAEEPVPSTIATRPLSTPTLASVSEVDLPALEESLVLLDRLERRKGKATPTPVRPIIFEGPQYVTEETCPEFGGEPVGSGGVVAHKIVLKVEANNVSGIFDYVPDMSSSLSAVNLPFAGTYNSLTGERTVIQGEEGSVCEAAREIYSLQATLSEDNQKFEGTQEDTSVSCGGELACKTVWTFSLTRK